MPPILRFLTHKRTIIAVSNLQPRTRSATRAIPPIPAPIVLVFRQEPRRQYRSTGAPIVPARGLQALGGHPFVPLLASNSQHTWLECLACPLSISAVKPLPKSRTRKTYVRWGLDRQVTHLQSAAAAT